MRLADFILANREPILVEWEAFARTCAPASGTMDIEALRDDAEQMLIVIARDLRTPQSPLAQSEKSKGLAHAPPGQADESKGRAHGPPGRTAAESHGAARARSGFTVGQMVAEYRALRASVLRLWTKERGHLETEDIEDLSRFHEAIDQALAESAARYNQDVEQAKETFLAILGHDLRLPLGAISSSAKFMLEVDELEEPHRMLTERIIASAARTLTMVGDLLDFTRTRLGGGIPVERAETNLSRVVRDVVEEISLANPERPVHIEGDGDLRGRWDSARISQALGNLIGNAVQHGTPGTGVTVDLRGGDREVAIAIHNRGAVIPPAQLDGIFNPMKTRSSPREPAARGPTGSLGLGLYIAERIVNAHKGHIEVESSESRGTTFTVHLPRGEHPAEGGSPPSRP